MANDNPEQLVHHGQPWPRMLPLEGNQLLTEGEVLEQQASAGAKALKQ